MTASDGLKLAADLAPIVSGFVKSVEGTSASGADKKAAVLDLTGTVYEGARRLGALSGVKEVRDVPWEALAPLISILIDAIVAAFNRLGVFLKKPGK